MCWLRYLLRSILLLMCIYYQIYDFFLKFGVNFLTDRCRESLRTASLEILKLWSKKYIKK